jgi:hypothetical protein
MTATAKTAITIDTSALVDGASAEAADVLTPISGLLTHVKSGRCSVSANDTHGKHLRDALIDSAGNWKWEIVSPAGNETLRGNLDATGQGGRAPMSTGSGWAWTMLVGLKPLDMTVVAGETLAERDYVYVDLSSGTAFKVDTNATPIKCGVVRGFVVTPGGIANAASGLIRLQGEVSGFSGLTAWAEVWASTTAGGYTQMRPNPSAGGGQVASIRAGIAVSTSVIHVLPGSAEYLKRESLANAGTTTIVHHSDPQARSRKVRVFVSSTTTLPHASYADTNRDSTEDLRGVAAAGATTPSNTGSTTNGVKIGRESNQSYAQASQIGSASDKGLLTDFTIYYHTANGSPVGTITWEIRPDNGGVPGSLVLRTGAHANPGYVATTYLVTLSDPLPVTGSFWIVLKSTNLQTNGLSWEWAYNSTGTVGSAFSTDNGVTWTTQTTRNKYSATLAIVGTSDKLSQSFAVSGTQVLNRARLWLRKQGSPTGTMTLRVETDASGSPSGTLAHANATATVVESTLSSSAFGWVEFDFTDFEVSGGTYWLVLTTDRAQSDSNYVQWGADFSSPGYTDGEMKKEVAAAWSAVTKDSIFEMYVSETAYDEPCSLRRWSGGTEDVAVRFDDGSGGSGDTNTTFRNNSGGTLDMTCVVEME